MKPPYGNAARDNLAAGYPIYYREADTPPGTCIKKYPDGHCELVMFDREKGEVFVSELLDDKEIKRFQADLMQSIRDMKDGRLGASRKP
jgi:hypothetical protein